MTYYLTVRTLRGTELTKTFESDAARQLYLIGWSPYVTVLAQWEA